MKLEEQEKQENLNEFNEQEERDELNEHENLGSIKKYYRDDNCQLAQTIASMFPPDYQPGQPEQPEDLEQRNIERQQYNYAAETNRTGAGRTKRAECTQLARCAK